MQYSSWDFSFDRACRFNTASGMNCMQLQAPFLLECCSKCFNTASGMNCMQYCFPEPLETANSKAGFLKLLLFLRFSPNPREFFCRKIGSKELLQPVISRKLLSMRKTWSSWHFSWYSALHCNEVYHDDTVLSMFFGEPFLQWFKLTDQTTTGALRRPKRSCWFPFSSFLLLNHLHNRLPHLCRAWLLFMASHAAASCTTGIPRSVYRS